MDSGQFVSGDCVHCGAPIKFAFDNGGVDDVLPLTGKPLHRICAQRLGYNVDAETMLVCHREPRCVTRTWPRGRSTDTQILDFASSGRPFDDDEQDDADDHRAAWMREVARSYFTEPGFDRRYAGHGPLRDLLAVANNPQNPMLQLEALELLSLIAGIADPHIDEQEDVR